MKNTTNPEHPEGGKRISSRQTKKKQSKVLYYVILLVLLGILVFSTVKIVSYFKQQSDAENVQQDMQNNYITAGETDGETSDDGTTAEPDPDTISVDFDSMCADYPDVVGYIYSANTNIKYPIQYGKGNDYYLDHDSTGSSNNNGSIFIEQLNSSSFSDNNTIIYGHNMKSGLMFANLTLYKDKSYYSSHPYLYIYTPSQNYRLDLYAGFICEHDDEVYATSLTQSQLEAMAAKSTFTSNIGTPTGKTVTLSTCSYEFDNARYVVVGSLVPID